MNPTAMLSRAIDSGRRMFAVGHITPARSASVTPIAATAHLSVVRGGKVERKTTHIPRRTHAPHVTTGGTAA